ncbi:phospholipid phosphatase-related protein type 4-like isoform X2 [Entelurus aequoreus]|uniref:phospholipid phosphatase-related protein type 4-like isoform X2 n=1 Tax=Entelurus aequoreus TaxID=161455 RepID=UPI002B1DBF51|nr:phospholipid phosphatase-related protein type 4-like isoform X2 [Entelurus aequoreus]
MSSKERVKLGKEDSVTLLPCFYFVEIPILALAIISLYFLEQTDLFQPVHSGYSCSDKSLSLPYNLHQQEVCPLPLLFSLVFAIPTATIVVGEAIVFCYLSRRSSTMQIETNIHAAGCHFNSYIRRAVRFIGVHIFGLCVTALITDIFQLSTGQHTPYWLDVCKPNLTHINMSTCDEAFILEDICSGQDISLITAGRKSFPSQHATLAAFGAVYVSMYFNTVLTDSTKLLKPLLVFSFIMLAILAGLTRIIQFRNHPVDVYCGWMLGTAIAIYLGIYAVGSFQPCEAKPRKRRLALTLRKSPPPSVSSVSQSEVSNNRQVGHHMLTPSQPEPINTRSTTHTFSPNQAERILTRSSSYREPSRSSLKVANAEVKVIVPPSPLESSDKSFSSSTLPRSHGGSSSEGCRIPRRHASIHTSMDSVRSKQLLNQWKNKNDNRKLSLQNGGVGLPGGSRMTIQSRPGSSQLVHIPEEENSTIKDQESESEDSTVDVFGSAKQNWMRVTEKTTLPCRPLSAGGQPRLMQVMSFSKHHGLLNSTRSEDSGSVVSCTGSIRYRALTDHDPSPPASTTGAAEIEGKGLERTGSIVRVEAHPESRVKRPFVKPPSTDGSGSWRWNPADKQLSLRQPAFTVNNTDCYDSLKDGGPLDGRESEMVTKFENKSVGEGVSNSSLPHMIYSLHPSQTNKPNHFQDHDSNRPPTLSAINAPPFHPHPQAITTIRVTPVEGTGASSDGSSECQSVASSSRESTLRKKSVTDIHHTQDQGLISDHLLSQKSSFFDSESGNHFSENLHHFQDNPMHPNRQLQGMLGRPSPHPPPTLPRPLMTYPPPSPSGLALMTSSCEVHAFKR